MRFFLIKYSPATVIRHFYLQCFFNFLQLIFFFVKNTNWKLLQKLLERTSNLLRIFTDFETMRKWEIYSKHVFSAVFRHSFAVFLEFSTISIFFVKNANWNFKWLLESTGNFRRISTGFETAEKIQNFIEIVSHFFGIFLCSIFAKNYNTNSKNSGNYHKFSQSTDVLKFLKISVCSLFWNFLIFFFFKKYKFKFI